MNQFIDAVQNPFALAMVVIAGAIGFIIGKHSRVEIELHDPNARRLRDMVNRDPIVLPRVPALIGFILGTVVFALLSVVAIKATVKANDSLSQSEATTLASQRASCAGVKFFGGLRDQIEATEARGKEDKKFRASLTIYVTSIKQVISTRADGRDADEVCKEVAGR